LPIESEQNLYDWEHIDTGYGTLGQ